jgi:hypothetical protein
MTIVSDHMALGRSEALLENPPSKAQKGKR